MPEAEDAEKQRKEPFNKMGWGDAPENHQAWANLLTERFREPTDTQPSKDPTHEKPKEPPTAEELKAARAANDYVQRVIDRQLNKARGLLTFNSLLLTLVSVSTRDAKQDAPVELATMAIASAFAVASCVVLLNMMLLRWGDYDDSHNHRVALLGTVKVAAERTTQLKRSVWLTRAALVAAGVVLVASVIRHFGTAPNPQQHGTSAAPSGGSPSPSPTTTH